MADDGDLQSQITPESLARFSADVQGFRGELQKGLEKELKDLGDAATRAIKTKLRQSPRTGGRNLRTRPHHSRDQAAQGVDAKVTATGDGQRLAVTADNSHMSRDHEAFPFVYNKERVTHPVFGRGRVSQQGNPFFDQGEEILKSRAETQFSRALQSAADTVKGSR